MIRNSVRAFGLIAGLIFLSPASPLAAQDTGAAVYYSDWYQGRTMANGDIFDQAKLTASHKTYPFGSMVKVTNLANDNSVTVKVTDRMATRSKMLISVSRSAAEQLGFVKNGKTQVRLELVERGNGRRVKPSPTQN